jgi:acyl-CoA thioester hydrolase
MRPANAFTTRIVAADEDIDILGHVNNVVWVRWIQLVAERHWLAGLTADYDERYSWIIMRHEIDYHGNVKAGDAVDAHTWVEHPVRISRYTRRIDFCGPDGKVKVASRTVLAIIDKKTGLVTKIPPDMPALFSV